MFKRLVFAAFKVLAIGAIAIVVAASATLVVRWMNRPSPYSAEGLLARADELAWNNNWLAAFPIYVKAEEAFEGKGDTRNALYAHVSQFAVRMETGDLPGLITELNRDLSMPAARDRELRLRILEMKGKCEEEYDSAMAQQTFAEVERLSIQQRKFYLASRASGEEGILAFMTGNLAEAARRVKRAYVVAKYLGDPAAHVRYAEILGLGIEQLGRPQQALIFLDEAIATQKSHPEVALPYIAYNAKVDALADLGRYKDALALADQAIYLPRTYNFYGQLQLLLTSRSDVLIKEGKTSEALAGYEEALADARKLKSWRAINTVDGKLASALEHSGALRQALTAIDEAIEANKQTPEEMFLVPGNLALKARLQAELGRRADAETLYAKGADISRALLTRVPTPEVERLLLTEMSDLYSGYFELLSGQGRYAEAFGIIEQARGRIEAQNLEYDRTALPHYASEEEIAFQRSELTLLNSDNPQQRAEILEQALASKQNATDQSTEETPVSLTQLQKQLRPEELLIEYVLGDPQSYALLISHSKVNRYILSAKAQIEKDARGYRDRLRKRGVDANMGRKLFTALLGFTHDLSEFKSIIVVADGELHLLPFSALIDDSGKYLLETKTVSVAPSGTVLSLLRERQNRAAVSRPYLGVAPWAEDKNPSRWTTRAISSDLKSADPPALPDSRDEVESIAAMVPKPSTVLIGPEATKQRFESLPLSNYRVLHLALHGVVDSVFPDRSALLFAPSKEDNGRLEAKDIRRLHLNAQLVTLSACDTAVGPIGAAGVESLDMAFIEAGANSVVSTRWALEDNSSDQFMKMFYKRLNKEDKAEALRGAKLDLMKAGAQPYYWAAYELVGDPTGPVFATQ
jgi:CHAT domain-containing protein